MDTLGFIHEKLDLKILILYLLSKLPSKIEINSLYELCLCDSGVGYFEFSDCLGELSEHGHVENGDEGIIITDKGRRNVEAVASSLPFSVREKADLALEPVCQALVRKSLISVSHTTANDGCVVSLKLSDGVGEILNLSFLCADVEQATDIEKKFDRDAELYYGKIIEMFTGE